MRLMLSRWLLSALLIGWAVSHAAVFGQDKAASTVEKLRQGLNKAITVDYAGQSLAEVLNHLQEKIGVPINLDQAVLMDMEANANVPVGGAPMQIRVKATNEKASQVLRKFLNVHYLSYVILEDAVLVTSDEMATARQYLQRVNVAVEETPFKKAVGDLARRHGINLMIDPKMTKQAETAVSIELDNVSLETAIRLLAELANLKSARMGSVMYITSDEKAKKIREEEQHQFDNPLNPPVPGGIVSGRGGLMGAPAGGAAAIRVMPPNAGPPPQVVVPPVQVIPAGGIQPPPPQAPPQPFGK